MKGTHILDVDGLNDWLETRPLKSRSRESLVLINRLVLRILPLLFRTARNKDDFLNSAINAFWSAIIGRSLLRSSNSEIDRAAGEANAFNLDLYSKEGAFEFVCDAARRSVSNPWIVATTLKTVEIAERAIYVAVDDYRKDYTEASRIWEDIRTDVSRIEFGMSTNELTRFPLWNEKPNWADFRRDNKSILRGENLIFEDGFKIWLDWYEAVSEGKSAFNLESRETADLLERQIALGSKDELFNKKFWNREPNEINAEIAEWVAEARAAEVVGEARPAGYRFVDDGQTIKGHYSAGAAFDADIAQQTFQELVQKLKDSAERLGRAQVDPALPKAIRAIADYLEKQSASMNAGLVLSQFRAWETNLASVSTALGGQQFGDDLPALLASTQQTFEDLKAMFPSIAKIEANRLALRLQSADAQTVDQSIVAISVVAEANIAVDQSARDALKDLQIEVSRLNEIIASSNDHDAVAGAIETRGVIVGQRAMTTAGFAHTVLKAAGNRIAKGAGDGLEKGVADVTEAGVKLALVSLAGYLVGPLGALAAVVTMFKPLEKKATDIKEQSDVADV